MAKNERRITMKTDNDKTTDTTAAPTTDMRMDEVNRLKEDILACIAKRGSNTTFAELSKYVEGFNGEYQYNTPYSNLIIWSKMSKDAVEAIYQLNREKRVILSTVSIWVYIYEGRGLNVPVAKRLRAYKKPHWLPTVINRTYHPADKPLSHRERVAELRKLIR